MFDCLISFASADNKENPFGPSAFCQSMLVKHQDDENLIGHLRNIQKSTIKIRNEDGASNYDRSFMLVVI